MVNLLLPAQRLAAQRLGHDRLVVTILTGFLKLHSNVFTLSLGQVSCSGVLGLASSFYNLISYFLV